MTIKLNIFNNFYCSSLIVFEFLDPLFNKYNVLDKYLDKMSHLLSQILVINHK